MAGVRVPKGAVVTLGRVEGALEAGRGATIRAADGRLVVVAGEARFKGDARVECDLECESLKVGHRGRVGAADLTVSGNLTVHGKLDAPNSIEVGGTMTADQVDVGGRLKALSASCKSMRVGGVAEVSESLKAESVDIGGRIFAPGLLDVGDLKVGGRAEIGGGSVKGTISVSGRFESASRLEFGELQVYGTCSLSAGSKGRRIMAFGKLRVGGDLESDQVEVRGVARAAGNIRAVRAEVQGRLSVAGWFATSERLDVHGMTEVAGAFNGEALTVSGNFSAERAVVTKDAEISGSVSTRKGLKAASVVVGRGTRCDGPIIGETVEVGDSGPGWSAFVLGQRLRLQGGTTRVHDVYAAKLFVGAGSMVGRVYAETVELGPGCDVEEVSYVNELKTADHVTIAHPVKEVSRLQEPPL